MWELPAEEELEFRDGERACPPHVVSLLRGIDTTTLTYEEAIKVANNRMLTDALNGAQRRVIQRHFAQRD